MFSKHKEKAHPAPEAAAAELQPAQAAGTEAPPSACAETPAPAAPPSAPAPEAAELAAIKDRYARLMADFDNFRKRQSREREELVKRANEELIGDLLPIVDHLELAIGKTPDLANPFVAGVKLVYDQFIALLERYGATPIDAKGQPFNPDWHEALSQMPSATVPANEVIDQFRRGWSLGGRLLRPTQVIVSSGAPDAEQAAADNASVSD